MTLRHWDSLLAGDGDEFDLSDGITFGQDDTYQIGQTSAASGTEPTEALIKGQSASTGDALPGAALRLEGGDPGAVGQFGGGVVVDVGPAVSNTTAALKVQSDGSNILELLLYSTIATLRAAAGLSLRLLSDTSVYLSVGNTGVSTLLSSSGTFALSFVKRLTMSGGQRSVTPAGGAPFSGTLNIDGDVCERWHYVINGAVTFAAPTNVMAGARYTIRVTQDVVGNRLATWNSVFKFGSLSGTLSTAANAVDIFVFEGSDSGNMHCIIAAKGVHT